MLICVQFEICRCIFSTSQSSSLNLKDQLNDLFTTYMTLFNEGGGGHIGMSEWLRHGAVNRHMYASSACVDRVAQSIGKFTSSRELSCDYRPYLHAICRQEESRLQQQQASARNKRFLHYLNQIGFEMSRDDCALLAKSNLVANETSTWQLDRAKSGSSGKLTSLFSNSQLYEDS